MLYSAKIQPLTTAYKISFCMIRSVPPNGQTATGRTKNFSNTGEEMI
jgi:hypothetical protein